MRIEPIMYTRWFNCRNAEANFFVHCIRLKTEWDIDGAQQLPSLFQDC